jgi:hypothetical protein
LKRIGGEARAAKEPVDKECGAVRLSAAGLQAGRICEVRRCLLRPRSGE